MKNLYSRIKKKLIALNLFLEIIESINHSFNATDRDTVTRLNSEVLDDTVNNNSSVSVCSDAESNRSEIFLESQLPGKRSHWVRGKDNLVVGTEGLSPGTQYKSIVGRENNNLIHTSLLELIVLGDERRNVLGSASWSEGSWNRNKHNGLTGKFLFRVPAYRNGTGKDVCCFLSIRDVLQGYVCREFVYC